MGVIIGEKVKSMGGTLQYCMRVTLEGIMRDFQKFVLKVTNSTKRYNVRFGSIPFDGCRFGSVLHYSNWGRIANREVIGSDVFLYVAWLCSTRIMVGSGNRVAVWSGGCCLDRSRLCCWELAKSNELAKIWERAKRWELTKGWELLKSWEFVKKLGAC